MISSAKCFLLVLVGFLGSRQTFSSTRARFSLLPVLALLLSALGLFVAAPAQATTPVVNLWASPSLVLEGSDVTITARLTSALESQVTIPLTLTDNSAESTDHGTLANITINPGSTSGTGTISTNQDTDEDDETFTVALNTANLPSSVTAGGRSSVQITILDDDPFPTVSLSASPNPVLLGETMVVRVTLSFALSRDVRIPVNSIPVPAPPGRRASTFTIDIPAGETSGALPVRYFSADGTTVTRRLSLPLLLPGLGWPVLNISPSSLLITANPPPPPRDTGRRTPSPALSGDASLNTLGIEGISPDFDPDTYTYTLNAYGESTVTLTPRANHENAEITVNGETIESGSSATVPLDDDGETTITIVVTAEDGTTTRTYEITVTHCGEEREDLVRFYEKTGGEDWSDNENWNSQEPLGQWFGVETNEDDKVISLRLPDNGLSGETPREQLLCLSELKELALWDNDSLSGEVPEELVLAVERAALRDVAVALSLNTEWFESYENPYDFSGWDSGVTTDDDRVTELDFSGREEIEGTIPAVLLEQLERLGTLYVNCTVSVEGDTPAEVNVEEVCEEPEPPKEPEEPSGGGGCALSSGSGDSPVFGLFLMTLLVFAVLGRKRAR